MPIPIYPHPGNRPLRSASFESDKRLSSLLSSVFAEGAILNMVMTSPYTSLRTHTHGMVKGSLFGARGGSCSCDPCDCNPCHCGDALPPNLPLWRVSGCFIREGHVGETDLAHLILLSVALPGEENAASIWEEILLVDQRATPAQIDALLDLFDDSLESMPAEIETRPQTRRAVYRVSIVYIPDDQRPLLRVSATDEQMVLLRAAEDEPIARSHHWIYDGPMAPRGDLDLHF